jgi:hypothetical protein
MAPHVENESLAQTAERVADNLLYAWFYSLKHRVGRTAAARKQAYSIRGIASARTNLDRLMTNLVSQVTNAGDR